MRGPSISRGAGFRADRSSISFAISAHMRHLGIQPMTEFVQFITDPNRAPEPRPEPQNSTVDGSLPQTEGRHDRPAPSVYHDPNRAAVTAAGADVNKLNESGSRVSLSFGKFDLQSNGDDYASDVLVPPTPKNTKKGNNAWLYQASPGVLRGPSTPPDHLRRNKYGVPNLFIERSNSS